tara:strand:+ start:1332 stop:2330 length:999 start_codon:yes stop_codon:yes gene_type:complete
MNFPKLICPESRYELYESKESYKNYLKDKKFPETIKYPIINKIPRLLTSPNNYCSAFGDQWKRWKKTQLDSHTKLPISKDRLYRCLTTKGINLFMNSEKKLQLLEVGCGAGRFTEILLNFNSLKITSMDLSDAVEVNQENFPQNDSHRIIQADINKPPFEDGKFDVVLCLGVIQHTPDPEETITNLYKQVVPGGILVFDHYTPNLSRYTKITSNLIRPIIKRFNKKYRTRVVEALVNIFFPIHRSIRNIPYAQQIFSRISPIQTYYHAYPGLTERLQKDWAFLDTHDSLTDWFKHLRNSKEIHKTLSNLGAKEIRLKKDGNGIEVFCKKPFE